MRIGLVFRLFKSAAAIQRKRMFLTVSAIAWGTVSIVLLLAAGFTAAGASGCGYNFEGALQQYTLMDERVIIDPETGERFLIPVSDEPSASAVGLLEPWACVELGTRLHRGEALYLDSGTEQPPARYDYHEEELDAEEEEKVQFVITDLESRNDNVPPSYFA